MSRSNPAHAAPGRGWIAAIVVAGAAVVAAGVLTVVATSSPGAADATIHGTSGPGHGGHALVLVSATPAGEGPPIAPDAAITLTFNSPLAAFSPLPSLAPAVDGSWVRSSPTSLTFTPAGSLPPGASVSLTVPGGPGGVEGDGRTYLASTVTRTYTVAPMSTLRVQQLLAQLDYLPLSFTPDDPTPVPVGMMALDQPGTFAWRWTTFPASFTSMWAQGAPDAITTGAIMAFEADHQLGADGVAGPQVWAALLAAAAAGTTSSYGHYDWVDVSTALPEQVTVWRDGSPAYTTPANTGIEAAPTAKGTWPVYARYTSTTMSGTNPDGSHYSDPGVPWVSYFHGGDALHGFIRPGYGYPQSLGCVEMPPANAAAVYPLTPLGTLVTVE